MKAFHWQIVGVVALALLALIATGCAVSDMRMRSCMRSNFLGVISYVLMGGSAALSVWLGFSSAKHTGRDWVGWVCGVALFFALGFLLAWLGFEFPRGASGE